MWDTLEVEHILVKWKIFIGRFFFIKKNFPAPVIKYSILILSNKQLNYEHEIETDTGDTNRFILLPYGYGPAELHQVSL